MKRKIVIWQACGYAATTLFGTLLHFLYDWTDESILLAPFSGINESTWEHMKLLYFPLLIFALVQRRYFRLMGDFWCVKFLGILSGLIAIPMLFYTYNGAFGKSPDWVNISIFFLSAAIAFFLETRLFKNGEKNCKMPWIPFVGICFIGILFVVFTFYPPELPLFKDPITNSYGL